MAAAVDDDELVRFGRLIHQAVEIGAGFTGGQGAHVVDLLTLGRTKYGKRDGLCLPPFIPTSAPPSGAMRGPSR